VHFLLRIRIRFLHLNLMWIHADLDPEPCCTVYSTSTFIVGFDQSPYHLNSSNFISVDVLNYNSYIYVSVLDPYCICLQLGRIHL
jgi:hypothetical protein